jgi:hypothetical protein
VQWQGVGTIKSFGVINFTLGIVALWMLVIGLRGLIGRRPFLLPARSGFWLMVLVFVPTLLSPFRFWLDGGIESQGLSSLLVSLLMVAVLLIMVWKQTSGYMMVGLGEESFRQALQNTLKKLNFPFEESLSRVRLTTLEADLQVNIQSWMGTAYLRMRQPQHADSFRRIVNSLREEIAASTAQLNLTMCSFYIAFGILALAASVFIL